MKEKKKEKSVNRLARYFMDTMSNFLAFWSLSKRFDLLNLLQNYIIFLVRAVPHHKVESKLMICSKQIKIINM